MDKVENKPRTAASATSAAQPLPRPKVFFHQPSPEKESETEREKTASSTSSVVLERHCNYALFSHPPLICSVSHGLHLAITAPIPSQPAPGFYNSGRSLADSTVFCLPRTISPIKESLSQSLACQENDLQKMLDRKSQRHWNISMLLSMILDVDTNLH